MSSKPKRRQDKELTCGSHSGETLRFFCTLHNELICALCSIRQHKQCHETLTFQEATERFEDEKNSVLNEIESFHALFSAKDQENAHSLGLLKPRCDDIKRDIMNIRERLNMIIEQKEKYLLSAVERYEKVQEAKMMGKASQLQMLISFTSKLKERADEAYVKPTELLRVKSISRIVNKLGNLKERSFQYLLDSRCDDLDFDVSPTVEEFLEDLDDIGELTITSAEQPEIDHCDDLALTVRTEDLKTTHEQFEDSTFNEEKRYAYPLFRDGLDDDDQLAKKLHVDLKNDDFHFSSDDEYQTDENYDDADGDIEGEDRSLGDETDDVSHVDELKGKMTTFMTVDHGKGCWLYGIVFLQDGRLVITDVTHDSLQMYSKTYDLLSESRVSFTPWDITTMSSDTVAVAAGGKSCIKIFRVNNNDFDHIKDIDVGSECISVFFNEQLFIAGTWKGGVLLSPDGEVLQRIEKNSGGREVFRRADFIASDDEGKNVFLTNSWASKIVCLTRDGVKIWEYQIKGMNPRGIHWEKDKLIIACKNQNKLIAISRDGKQVNDLLTEGLDHPYAISYHRESNRLVVSEWDEKMVSDKTRLVRIIFPGKEVFPSDEIDKANPGEKHNGGVVCQEGDES
ncbi:hypothetical protein CHS0354_027165 [Potamilus streckersoni]|uniref:B box-type domain-containing protein n=1 Tax=Potamilus streckersoni TaxID=2493646 RepID=A0AAE0TJJ5_9BIVA|nr:hypothetical protein CHS0354_027165 [Potamilus streckersoni]